MIAEASQYVAVASFVEAWIEIVFISYSPAISLSPPSWRRGLKYVNIPLQYFSFWSPPSWRRGLKFWFSCCCFIQIYRRLLRGGVDWNRIKCVKLLIVLRRLLRGGVDWNLFASSSSLMDFCRLLRGGVDWNRYVSIALCILCVASFVEAWIEISFA